MTCVASSCFPHLLQHGSAWQCRLEDGLLRTLTDDSLHATGAAPEGATVAQFEPQQLASGLHITELPAWLSGYQNDPKTAVDLVLKRPTSRTWYNVLTGERSVGDLSSEEVLALQYLAPCAF